MKTWELSEPRDLDALLSGLGVMGTGGGGDPEGWGRSVFETDRAAGRSYRLIDPVDVPDDAFVLSGGYLGSIADDQALDRVVASWESNFELERAIRVLEEEHGRTVDCLVPFEMGGGNTPVVMSCAARLGIPVIDGDGVGRAAPETHMCSFLGHGISLTPMPLVGADGTLVLVRDGDTFLADAVGRCVSSRKKGFLANAHYGMSGAQLKRSVVPNTISNALEVGRCLHGLAPEDDAVSIISRSVGGTLLLCGHVTARREIEQQGFYSASIDVEDGDASLTLIVKNEVMCVKRDGNPLVIFPDLVFILDPDTGAGMMSTELVEDREVAVVGAPCSPVVRRAIESEQGRAAFSPSRYGESFEFVPIEALLKSKTT